LYHDNWLCWLPSRQKVLWKLHGSKEPFTLPSIADIIHVHERKEGRTTPWDVQAPHLVTRLSLWILHSLYSYQPSYVCWLSTWTVICQIFFPLLNFTSAYLLSAILNSVHQIALKIHNQRQKYYTHVCTHTKHIKRKISQYHQKIHSLMFKSDFLTTHSCFPLQKKIWLYVINYHIFFMKQAHD
jgi:hypothetical protein